MAVTKYEITGIYSLLNVSPTILVINVKVNNTYKSKLEIRKADK